MEGDGVGDIQVMWRAFLAANYFNIPKGQCQTCRNEKNECGKFFCVQCKVGGVCHATFKDGGEHAQHPRIRVWKVTRKFSVCVDDVRRFMPEALVNQIQLYVQNDRNNCKLFKPEPDAETSTSRRRVCHGCNDFISQSRIPNSSEQPVCSLQCLLDHELNQRRQGQLEERQRRRIESGERLRRRKQNKETIVRLDYTAEFTPQR